MSQDASILPKPSLPANPAAPTPEEAAYASNSAAIAAEIATKFTASESAADVAAPVKSGDGAASSPPAASASVPAPVASAADPVSEKLLSRLAALETQLAEARRPAPPAEQPAQAPVGFTQDDLVNDLVGTLKRAGIPADYAARAILGHVAPETLNPDQRALAATQGVSAKLQQQIDAMARDNATLRQEMRRSAYQAEMREFVPAITETDFPALSRAARNDPRKVVADLLAEAVTDARERMSRDPRAVPITPVEAARRVEGRLVEQMKLLGLSFSNITAPQPAGANAATAKPAPIIPAATALPGTAPSGAAEMTYEDKVAKILAEVRTKYASAETN